MPAPVSAHASLFGVCEVWLFVNISGTSSFCVRHRCDLVDVAIGVVVRIKADKGLLPFADLCLPLIPPSPRSPKAKLPRGGYFERLSGGNHLMYVRSHMLLLVCLATAGALCNETLRGECVCKRGASEYHRRYHALQPNSNERGSVSPCVGVMVNDVVVCFQRFCKL